MTYSLRPRGLQPTRLHPWDFPGKSTGVGCHCLLQGDPTNPYKRNQPRILFGRTDAEAPILWPPDEKKYTGFTFTFHFHALEKEMAPHSSVLA